MTGRAAFSFNPFVGRSYKRVETRDTVVMHIKNLVIENFKSIERIELVEPNPFTVFVGPNGSGKSNIFEALEFFDVTYSIGGATSEQLFKGRNTFLNRTTTKHSVELKIDISNSQFILRTPLFDPQRPYGIDFHEVYGPFSNEQDQDNIFLQKIARENRSQGGQVLKNFSRIFIKNQGLIKLITGGPNRLALDAFNLEPVLKRILKNDVLRAEIFEWLNLFVPGFRAVEVDDRNELHWFEEAHNQHFTKDLISDGTYNILAILAAVYQSDDQPQFLCIEEPENGLHPQVAGELVDFFRTMCEERGHYIWLNTHSQQMAARVRPEEFVVVDKRNGATEVKQFQKKDFYGMRADEAWLTNVLGVGLAW